MVERDRESKVYPPLSGAAAAVTSLLDLLASGVGCSGAGYFSQFSTRPPRIRSRLLRSRVLQSLLNWPRWAGVCCSGAGCFKHFSTRPPHVGSRVLRSRVPQSVLNWISSGQVYAAQEQGILNTSLLVLDLLASGVGCSGAGNFIQFSTRPRQPRCMLLMSRVFQSLLS